jgi:quinol-cytochrome oxidoreductase complex cytochrome b subunit
MHDRERINEKSASGWIRDLAAGLSARELRALLRGDPPVEKPNPRYLAHRLSFLLHLRPRSFPRAAVQFTNTFYLGFTAVLLLAVELVTGLFLMVYYEPTPSGAYPSILRIVAEVPFGALVRDIHRLAGEAMVICVALHLFRVYLSGAYKGKRRFTWVIGTVMLLCTLGMAFTGYLRPWDQRAYWAVTIGTSIIEAVPLVGHNLNLLVRGGPDIGASGLLRFNLLHVLILPMMTGLLLGAHYYRISRLHGISLPVAMDSDAADQSVDHESRQQVPFMPDMIAREALLTGLILFVLIATALYFYDAPLEHHADLRRTPLDTQAPWFFLWLQGLLKLGDKTLMGIFVPVLMVAGLFLTPFIDRTPRRPVRQRPVALAVAFTAVIGWVTLSYMGTHNYGIDLPPVERIAQNLVPQEGVGPLHAVPFDQLRVGLYDIDHTDAAELPDVLGRVFDMFSDQVRAAGRKGKLSKPTGVMMVEDWQADLKRVTLRMGWEKPDGSGRMSFERMVHLHRERR